MTGILKVQLLELETQAETLERIVYNYLVELEALPDGAVSRYEEKLLRKLEKLDEIQDEIDAVTAKLKEAGAWEPVSHSGQVYEYKPPKQAQPETTKPKGGITHKAGAYWDIVSATMPEQGGVISVYDVMSILNMTKTPCGNMVRHWASSGKLALSGSQNKINVYCRASDKALYQSTLVLDAIRAGAVSVKAITFALGYSGHSSATVVNSLAELEEQGVIANAQTGSVSRYLIVANGSQEAA